MSAAGSFCSQRRHAKVIRGCERGGTESRWHRRLPPFVSLSFLYRRRSRCTVHSSTPSNSYAHLWKCRHWKGTSCIIRRTLCACICDLGQYVMPYMVHMPIVSRDTVAIVTCRAYIPLSSSRQGDNIKDAFSKGRPESVNLFWV